MCELKVFLEFRDGEDARNICNPGRLVLISFLSAVGEGKRSVACAVSALKFTAALMGWQEFLCDLDCQVVSAWKQPVGPARACKEAMPLPLFAIAKLERAVIASGSFVKSMDTFLIVCFLVMFWGALRFSDLQRIEVETIELQGVIARGHCWKTKAPITGMPWGCLCAGIYGSWAPALAWVCKYMQAHDFMIAGPSGSRASFTYVMAQFRRILVSYGGIPADVVHNYSLHSLKATPLSWALQVEVEPTMSRLWGHHRSREHGEAMVREYGRDDVLPALRAQWKVLKAIWGGWVPLTPQARGGKSPVAEYELEVKPRNHMGAPPACFRRVAPMEIVTRSLNRAQTGNAVAPLRLAAPQTRTPSTERVRTARSAIRLCRVFGY